MTEFVLPPGPRVLTGRRKNTLKTTHEPIGSLSAAANFVFNSASVHDEHEGGGSTVRGLERSKVHTDPIAWISIDWRLLLFST